MLSITDHKDLRVITRRAAQKLSKLGAEVLGKLREEGHLQAAFMVVVSLSNFRDLIERANKPPAELR